MTRTDKIQRRPLVLPAPTESTAPKPKPHDSILDPDITNEAPVPMPAPAAPLPKPPDELSVRSANRTVYFSNAADLAQLDAIGRLHRGCSVSSLLGQMTKQFIAAYQKRPNQDGAPVVFEATVKL